VLQSLAKVFQQTHLTEQPNT